MEALDPSRAEISKLKITPVIFFVCFFRLFLYFLFLTLDYRCRYYRPTLEYRCIYYRLYYRYYRHWHSIIDVDILDFIIDVETIGFNIDVDIIDFIIDVDIIAVDT